MKSYYEKNRARCIAHARAYYQRNLAKCRQQRKDWRIKHRDYERKRARERYYQKVEHCRKVAALYYRNNRAMILQKARAKKRAKYKAVKVYDLWTK